MKRLVYFILVLFFISINIFSQDDYDEPTPVRKTKGFIGSAAIGFGVPVGDLDAGYKGGFNISANAGYIFSNLFGARFGVAYNRFSLDAALDGGAMNIISMRGDFLVGNFKKNAKTILYSLAGIGAYFKSTGDIKDNNTLVNQGSSEMDFGIAIGGGAAFKFSKKVAFFGELQYNHSFNDKLAPASFVPFKVGVMMIP